jgi:HSP20 family protein
LVALFFGGSLLDEAETLARAFWKSGEASLGAAHIHPRMDFYREGNGLVLKAELPGIAMEDIDVSLQEGYLVLKAEKKLPEVESERFLTERYEGQYYRSVALPVAVDEKKISATFEQGVLEVRLPMAKEAKPKHIKIGVK